MTLRKGDMVIMIRDRQSSYFKVRQYETLEVVELDIDGTVKVKNSRNKRWWVTTTKLQKINPPTKQRRIIDILNS